MAGKNVSGWKDSAKSTRDESVEINSAKKQKTNSGPN
jgi:hypothetical protein